MARTLAEEAVSRVMQYLTAAGVHPTPEVMVDALSLVREVIEQNGKPGHGLDATVLAEIMQAVPDRFSLPEPHLPPASPPLARGSIRYGEV